jgi:hypothetical protein
MLAEKILRGRGSDQRLEIERFGLRLARHDGRRMQARIDKRFSNFGKDRNAVKLVGRSTGGRCLQIGQYQAIAGPELK